MQFKLRLSASDRSGPFQPPQPPEAQPSSGDEALRQELKALKQGYEQAQANEAALIQALQKQAQELTASLSLQQQWENLAEKSEAEKAQLAESLSVLQIAASQQPPIARKQLKQAAKQATGLIQLDEAATRELIDAQLQEAGWECDTKQLSYAKGTRPEPNCNKAITEWPCKGGNADYVCSWGSPQSPQLRPNEAERKGRCSAARHSSRHCRQPPRQGA